MSVRRVPKAGRIAEAVHRRKTRPGSRHAMPPWAEARATTLRSESVRPVEKLLRGDTDLVIQRGDLCRVVIFCAGVGDLRLSQIDLRLRQFDDGTQADLVARLG